MARIAVRIAVALAIACGAPARAGAIGFIDSPSATCRKIKGNQCMVSWYYVSVGASPNYIVDLWIILDGVLVLKTSGFFQTSLYLSTLDLGEGFQVHCGGLGSTPAPEPTPFPSFPGYGKSYSYAIRARDSSNLTSANYGTVVCPPRDQ